MAILVDTSSSWGRDIIRGAARQVRVREGWRIEVEARGLSERLELRSGWTGDGVIARVSDAEMARELKRSRLPVVNVSAVHVPEARFHRVATDVEAAGRMAAAYFLDRGFRHFGYLSLIGLEYVSRQRRAFAGAVREAGYVCNELGIELRRDLKTPADNPQEEEIITWLRGLPKPVALFMWSGGRQIIDCCRKAGIAVPEEVAFLSGSNDTLLCEVSDIPISAVQQPCERIGGEAVAILEKLMNGVEVPAAPIWLPPGAIVTRQSTDTMAVNDTALVAALRFIREAAGRPVQVRDVAAAAGVSRRVLERRFATHLKSSPAEHLRRAHLDRAKSLLAETDLPIPEIAEASGFGSPEYMAQTFRTWLDVSPLRYRRQIRGR